MKKIRIGSGAGYGGDRLEPALTLLSDGALDYLCLECLAERTIALAQKEKLKNPDKGYNHLLEYRMEKILPLAYKNKVKIISNMGAANSSGAIDAIYKIADRLGLKGMKIVAVLGDDVSHLMPDFLEQDILESGEPLSTIKGKIISANAYLGIEGILKALQAGADVIITGRVADPSLFLAPMVHEFGWSTADYDKMGKGTLLGHLLECAGQVTGGYYADPGKKEMPDLWNLGFPFVEVEENGEAILSKVSGTGGIVNVATCTEQLLYEIHDPEKYITPDCTANFSKVHFVQKEKEVVDIQGGTGAKATNTYKVSVGYSNGYLGTGEISYGGPNAVERAKLAAEIVCERIKIQGIEVDSLEAVLIGVNALFHSSPDPKYPIHEVRLRIAAKTQHQADALKIANEVEALYTNGPAGGGGATKGIEEIVSVASILIPKTLVTTTLEIKQIPTA
ncbi:MAG: acyclic terpene utilization AtuA family protein [Saprospiraceae bacterium]